jgi:hypothetical protein
MDVEMVDAVEEDYIIDDDGERADGRRDDIFDMKDPRDIILSSLPKKAKGTCLMTPI